MFSRQISFYKRKIDEVKKEVNDKTVKMVANGIGFNLDTLEEEFKANSVEFKKLAYVIAKSLSKGAIDVKSETYCSVIVHFAEQFGVDYKLFAGFCLPEDHPKYQSELEKIEKAKEKGDLHINIATHSYVEIEDKVYELFGNAFSGIAHMDVVELKDDNEEAEEDVC